jgi:hypothetical protein
MSYRERSELARQLFSQQRTWRLIFGAAVSGQQAT